MINIARVSTYPTDKLNKVGFHAFKLGGMDGCRTFFVSPNLKGEPLAPPAGDSIRVIPFFLKTYPLDKSYVHQIVFLIQRISSILLFSTKTILYLDRKKISIIHIHSPMYALIAFWGKIFGKKNYITFHGEDFNKIKNNRLYRIFSFLYDGVFVISPSMLNTMRAIHGKSKVFLVGNGIEFNFKNESRERKKQILFVGSFKKVKGHKMMIDGFKIFLEKNDYYKLIFAGDGPLLDEMKGYVGKLNLTNSVVFVGHKTTDELIDLYNDSQIFALNSFSEGFPKVLLEALACGCRVISTRVGSVPNILGENYPYFIEPHTPMGIAKVLNRIIAVDSDFFVNYEKIPKRYSWESINDFYRRKYFN